MEENPMVVVADMGSAALTDQPSSSWEEEEGCELEKMGIQKISVSDETNNLKFSSSAIKSDSFVVDMDRFSHLADKDMSRITLQRTVSRKGQGRSTGEKKANSTATSEKDSSISSPRSGGVINTLEKSMVVTMGAIDPPLSPHHNHHPHQITIVTAGNNNNNTSNNSENRLIGRKYSFKRSSPSNWSIDPRRILLFFATLSSMGTILLIYFTLSMGKLSGGGGGNDAAAQ